MNRNVTERTHAFYITFYCVWYNNATETKWLPEVMQREQNVYRPWCDIALRDCDVISSKGNLNIFTKNCERKSNVTLFAIYLYDTSEW